MILNKQAPKNYQGKIDIDLLCENVKKAQQGDNQAMEEIVLATSDFIYYYCLMMLKNEQDAMDAVQDIYILVIQKLQTVKNPKAFLGWLKVITGNYCNNKVRKKDGYILNPDEETDIFDTIEDEDAQVIPEEKVDNNETKEMLMSIIRELPDSQKECVLMYYYQEMSIKDIAATLSVSEGTIKSRLNYARKTIKDGVEKFESKGIKLYGLTPIPFLAYFLQSGAAALTSKPAVATIMEASKGASISSIPIDTSVISSAAKASTGIFAAGAGALSSAVTSKIAVGTMAALLLVGTGIATTVPRRTTLHNHHNNKATTVSTPDETVKRTTTAATTKPKKHNAVLPATIDEAIRIATTILNGTDSVGSTGATESANTQVQYNQQQSAPSLSAEAPAQNNDNSPATQSNNP